LTDLDEDSDVDLADLLHFTPQWLWEACRPHDPRVALPVEGSGELMMMGGSFGLTASVSSVVAVSDESGAAEERVTQLSTLAAWLENLWLEDADVRRSITPDDWVSFMEQVYWAISQEAALDEGSPKR